MNSQMAEMAESAQDVKELAGSGQREMESPSGPWTVLFRLPETQGLYHWFVRLRRAWHGLEIISEAQNRQTSALNAAIEAARWGTGARLCGGWRK